MLLTLLGLYAGAAAGYMGLKYAKTKDAVAKKKALDNWGKTYMECLKWPADLMDGIAGFDTDKEEDPESK